MPIANQLVFFVASILAGGFSEGFKLIPGVEIRFWPPAGLFVAALLLSPKHRWPGWIVAGCLAELTCNALWFHNALPTAFVYCTANALTAWLAAWGILRIAGAPFLLETFEDVVTFVLVGAGVAPMLSATVIAVTDFFLGKHSFATAWTLAYLGDGAGILVVTPMTIVAARTWCDRATLSPWRALEATALILVLLAVGSLAQGGYLPTVYLTMPPLLWIAVRFQLRGAAAALGLLTLLISAFTLASRGALPGDAALLHDTIVALQTFLTISAVSALLVAAISLQRQQALDRLQTLNNDLERRVEERTSSLRESEERLRLFIRHAPASIAMFDRQMRYLVVSRRWVSDFSLQDIDLMGRSHYEVFPDIPEAWKEAHRRGLAGEALASSCDRFDRASGLTHWVKWEILPWWTATGEVGGILIASEDITLARRSETALREANHRRNEFLATLAHELRNPLAPVRNALQILHLKSPPTPELQWARDVIDRQVQAMTHLIDDLMNLNRISRGQIELRRERLELVKVVQGAVETSRPLIEEMGHSLTVDLPDRPVVVDADLTRLAQVFLNLLNNAAKYTNRAGRLRLRGEVQGSDVVVSVKDNGIGIPPEKLDGIFEMFSQVESAQSRSRGGLGIGLCLVKQLVEMHGGSVSAHSAGLGQGSEFVVRLPIVVEAMAECAAIAEAPPTSNLRIVVADDNVDAARSLAMLLKMMGNHVYTFHDGEAAYNGAARHRPQVILCDIGMPKMNGYEVCRRIRREKWGHGMILVAVTGWGQEEDRRESVEAGFDHHLVKPVDPRRLMTLLAALDVVKTAE
ncbi:MAG: MASE1 domain-containing protein [Gemmataceae bacterium]